MADWDSASPADNDIVSSFPANERAARLAVQLNFGVDHQADASSPNIGKHIKVTLLNQTTDPAAVAGESKLYAKDVGGESQLYWRSSTGNGVQLTAKGGLRAESLVGTVPDARLSENIPRLSEPNVFTSATFGSVAGLNSVHATSPGIRFEATGADTDAKITLLRRTGEDGNQFGFQTRTDTGGGGETFLWWQRDGVAVTTLGLNAGRVTLNGVDSADYARKSVTNVLSGQQYIAREEYPFLHFRRMDAATDEGRYGIGLSATGTLRLSALNDGGGGEIPILTVTRSGLNVDTVSLAGQNITLNGVSYTDFARLSQRNTFSESTLGSSAGINSVHSSTPGIRFEETGAGIDSKVTLLRRTGDSGNQFGFQTRTDTGGVGETFLWWQRDGVAVTRLGLDAVTITLNGVNVEDYARLSQNNTFSGNVSVGGTLSGNGSGLTSLNAGNLSSGTIPSGRFPSTLPAASGANLTSLNASNLSSGTVPGARLGGNQTMSGNKTFSGNVTVQGTLSASGTARKTSAGGFLYNSSSNNLGGRIVVSNTAASTAAQVGSPGDMRFVYS